jgi:hypothetical protein
MVRQALFGGFDVFCSDELISGPPALSGQSALRAFKRGPLNVFRVAV